MPRKKLKLYRVKLEFRVNDSIEVEATNEEEAERLAMDQVNISPVTAEHYDTQVEELYEI